MEACRQACTGFVCAESLQTAVTILVAHLTKLLFVILNALLDLQYSRQILQMLRRLLRLLRLWLCSVWRRGLGQGRGTRPHLGLLLLPLCQGLRRYACSMCRLVLSRCRGWRGWRMLLCGMTLDVPCMAGRGMVLLRCLRSVCCVLEGVLGTLCFADVRVGVIHGVWVETHVPVLAHMQAGDVEPLDKLLTLQ